MFLRIKQQQINILRILSYSFAIIWDYSGIIWKYNYDAGVGTPTLIIWIKLHNNRFRYVILTKMGTK